jgi:hypothetical protein
MYIYINAEVLAIAERVPTLEPVRAVAAAAVAAVA